MFNRKKCSRCNSNINSKDKFCSSCGFRISKENSENLGMLGENDFIDKEVPTNPLEMLGGGMLGKMMNTAMKMLEKEMKKAQNQNINSSPMSNVELFINGKRVNPKNIKVAKTKIPKKSETSEKFLPELSFDSQKNKKFATLEKKEPVTNVRRFSNKIIYEIKMPGVASLNNISLTKLEKSIEIKAIGKTKSYQKTIPISLPIINYNLSKGVFKLELEAKN
jgi:HSP20 family molecular chaperone IbpA